MALDARNYAEKKQSFKKFERERLQGLENQYSITAITNISEKITEMNQKITETNQKITEIGQIIVDSNEKVTVKLSEISETFSKCWKPC